MEFIAVIVVWFVGVWLFRLIIGAIKGSAKAAGRSIMGKGTLKENMELEFKGMGPIRTQVLKQTIEDSDLEFLEVQCRGIFPINRTINAGFMISVLSKNKAGDLAPVISLIESFQEPGSPAFQDLTAVGEVSGDQGYINWVRIGAVPVDMLQPSIGGVNELNVVIRLVDMDNLPSINLGFGEGALWTKIETYSYKFKEKGYEEESAHRDEARSLSLKIGMAVAMADGVLDDAEGNTLKDWIKKIIAPFSDERQSELKKLYNDSMRDSYNLAKSGNLSLSEICSDMNKIGEDAQKYEALELAHEVMVADGILHDEEMKIIHKVADSLNIDSDELEKMRDQQIVKLDETVSGLDIEGLLGIDTSLDNEAIKTHLRKEFQKWNNRLNTLSEGEERDNAQQMLDIIAKARKKYE